MVRKKDEAGSGEGKIGKPTSTRNDKTLYRITMICGRAGGPVTAESVKSTFKCPSCNARAVVDVKDMKLVCDGHSLRRVTELP